MKKIIVGGMAVALCLALSGCGGPNEASVISNLNKNLDRVTNTISNVSDIKGEDITISDFMDQNLTNKNAVRTFDRFTRPEIERNSNYQSKNNALNSYINKVEGLYEYVQACNEINSQINTCKLEIDNMTKDLKNIKTNDIHIGENNLNAINELVDNISLNCSRINMSKNEVANELSKIKSLKKSYNQNSELLCAKYLKLTNSLDSRLSYYENIKCCLNSIKGILNCCDTKTNLKEEISLTKPDKNINNYENQTNQINYPNNQNEENNNANNSIKNIDTYKGNDNITNNNVNNNANNNTINNIPNQSVPKTPINNNNNGYNGNNGYGYNNNGYYNRGITNPDRNTDTYSPNVKNIDTYKGNGNYNNIPNGVNNGNYGTNNTNRIANNKVSTGFVNGNANLKPSEENDISKAESETAKEQNIDKIESNKIKPKLKTPMPHSETKPVKDNLNKKA